MASARRRHCCEGGQNPLTVFTFLPALIGGRQGNIWRLISAN
jgi:hypothetical protein